jgi:hypothetical protein
MKILIFFFASFIFITPQPFKSKVLLFCKPQKRVALANEGSGRHTHVESIAGGRVLDTQNDDDMGRVGRTPAGVLPTEREALRQSPLRARDSDAGLPFQDLVSRDPSPVAVRKCHQDIAALRSGNPDGDRYDKVRQRVRFCLLCVVCVKCVSSLVRVIHAARMEWGPRRYAPILRVHLLNMHA